MRIIYHWPPSLNNPKEIIEIEVEGRIIPRDGELVEINLAVSNSESVRKSGRVVDVVWSISKDPRVIVYLGA